MLSMIIGSVPAAPGGRSAASLAPVYPHRARGGPNVTHSRLRPVGRWHFRRQRVTSVGTRAVPGRGLARPLGAKVALTPCQRRVALLSPPTAVLPRPGLSWHALACPGTAHGVSAALRAAGLPLPLPSLPLS